MENSASTIENLVERIEQYTKTSFDLYKYTAIYKTAALFSSLAVKLVLFTVSLIATLLLTVALALWIGDILEKTAYGFLIMGSFYIFVGIVIFIFRKSWIEIRISNSIIDSLETKETNENYR